MSQTSSMQLANKEHRIYLISFPNFGTINHQRKHLPGQHSLDIHSSVCVTEHSNSPKKKNKWYHLEKESYLVGVFLWKPDCHCLYLISLFTWYNSTQIKGFLDSHTYRATAVKICIYMNLTQSGTEISCYSLKLNQKP